MQNYNIERVFSICVRFDSSLLFVGLECQINFDRFTVSHFHEFKDFFPYHAGYILQGKCPANFLNSSCEKYLFV